MKSKIRCFAVCLGIAAPCFFVGSTRAAPVQDLGRINGIVQQARELADGARQSAQSAEPANAFPADYHNPFAKSSNRDGRDGRDGVDHVAPTEGAAPASVHVGNQGTDVEVNQSDIRINAGGRTITIPRIQTPDSVDPGMAPHPIQGSQSPFGANLGNGVGFNAGRVGLAAVSGYQRFGKAVDLFRNGDFQSANQEMGQTANGSAMPFDQFHSLTQFAVGDYSGAAEFAYAASARSQLWDWRQLRSYYGNPAIYAEQYAALQSAARNSNAEPSTRFLLAYHHLMLGHRDAAANVLNSLQPSLPDDPVVHFLLSICQQAPPQPMR